MIDFQLKSAKNGASPHITKEGQLVTAPLAYSTPMFVDLAVNDQGYTFFPPIDGKRFVITDVIAIANRNVTTECVINIYESDDLNDATIAKSIFQLDMLKSTTLVMNGLNLVITEGQFLNGKTDDNNGLVTISGYYI